jgi:hypothetical protein
LKTKWTLACILGLTAITACFASAKADDKISFKLLRLKGHPVQWLRPAVAGQITLTYAIASQDINRPGAINCARMTSADTILTTSKLSGEAFRLAVADAFVMWQRVTNIQFVEASPSQNADIVIGAQAVPEGWAFADVQFDEAAPNATKPILSSAVCLNPQHHWKIGFDGNLLSYDLRYTLAHEIGHAIGLDHPSATGQLMSYRYDETKTGLQSGDLKGIQALYGRRVIDHAATEVAPAPPLPATEDGRRG